MLKEAKQPEDGENMGDNQDELPKKNGKDPNQVLYVKCRNVNIIDNQLIEKSQPEERV